MQRFFIIGNPRSGTTLFRLMLNKHSKICVPPEAGFLVWLYKEFKDTVFNVNYDYFIEQLMSTNKIETWNLDYEKLKNYLNNKKPSTFQDVMDCVYQFYTLDVLKKEINLYGDKNNYYLNHVDLLASLYQNAKFVHIIRDGRSVAASYKGVMKQKMVSKYAPKLPTEINDIASEWKTNISNIEKSFSKLLIEQKITIRYEDLVLEPEKTLIKVCDFLGLNFEKQMLNYYTTTIQDGLEPEEYLAWKQKNLQPLQKNEIDKYKQLTNKELIDFEKAAESFLKKYDYIN
ncbi:sulfotransferase family protein [Aliarcobacter skirrowii]|uniref:sulfotransferase family protein n=1 Tax=Aliarcobacter skirrowii TaxID=28200 RepID=UPI000D603C63|nr:sulfotransferase [Aliarcobacter skirrowii]PWE19058.1 hypothetical protein DGF29_09820 [Aliarcobacter skirrowii]PWE24812.1 hypothetical protein DGE88_08750 [Aliarcobacter skirrowii]RJO55004.1 sulfotransferase [Aliarcobacter skirrowii]RJO57049.1 sulfotransferase [Aliarcobacter skirrowii]